MTGTNICSEDELHRWMGALLCFVEAQSSVLAGPLRELCLKPGMLDPEYLTIRAKVPVWDGRQLASAVRIVYSRATNLHHDNPRLLQTNFNQARAKCGRRTYHCLLSCTKQA